MTDQNTLLFQSLSEVSQRIASRDLSPVDLTEAVLNAIDEQDEYYGAYVVVDREGAQKAALDAETEVSRGGYRGPLHGIPIGIKDIFGTNGLPTRCGSVIDAVLVPDKDAAVVANLRKAGAIIIGKTVTTEFALSGYHPTNRPPQNPWGKDRWAGVSSSGSGVSTAAGLAFGALGTDTGGSVRFPSAANGVVGLKPTFGRLSTSGVFPLAPSLDHVGAFGRRVFDAAIICDAAGGKTPRVPNQANSPRRPLRIGLDPAFVEAHADPEVTAAFEQAIGVFEGQGHHFAALDFGPLSQLAALWGPTTAWEAAEVHQKYFPEHADLYGPVFRNLLEEGGQLTADQKNHLESARRDGVSKLSNLLQQVDVLACPSAPSPSMPLSDFPPDAILPADAVAEFVTFTAPFNFSGSPTISAPCGFSTEGLPLSLQLIGKHDDEETLVQLMGAYEQATDWHKRRPPEPEVV